jgi:hypothetical protein
VTRAHQAARFDRAGGVALLWAALSAGPVAWTINQGVGYAIVKPACGGPGPPVLWAVAVLALALTAGGIWLARRLLGQLQSSASEEGAGVLDRSYFMTVVALGLNALIAILIVAALIPQVLLSPCE